MQQRGKTNGSFSTLPLLNFYPLKIQKYSLSLEHPQNQITLIQLFRLAEKVCL